MTNPQKLWLLPGVSVAGMRVYLIAIFSIVLLSGACVSEENAPSASNKILRLEMNLSAFGVEADHFPNIDAFIDFTKDSSGCKKSYYDPKYKDSAYRLTSLEIHNILKLLEQEDLDSLKANYTIGETDQPTSTITIFREKDTLKIVDYGLLGDKPLPEIYRIVYKLED